jgi:hypothetical protein
MLEVLPLIELQIGEGIAEDEAVNINFNLKFTYFFLFWINLVNAEPPTMDQQQNGAMAISTKIALNRVEIIRIIYSIKLF